MAGLTFDNLMKALLGTVGISGAILFIIVGATTFSQVLSFSGVVNGMLGLIQGQGLSPMVVLLGMILILLFLGCFVDQVSMMLITLPFFMPLVAKLGIDPIWFGVIFLICMQLGLLTPPFGLLLFTMKSVAPAHVTMNQIYCGGDALCRVRPARARADPGLSADRDLAAENPRMSMAQARTPRRFPALSDEPAGRPHEPEFGRRSAQARLHVPGLAHPRRACRA